MPFLFQERFSRESELHAAMMQERLISPRDHVTAAKCMRAAESTQLSRASFCRSDLGHID